LQVPALPFPEVAVTVKSMTLRLPKDQADELELIATVDGKPMSEEIREALLAHVSERRKDPEFQERLKRVMDENRAALRRLSS
jgi:predicted DNA-binding protein